MAHATISRTISLLESAKSHTVSVLDLSDSQPNSSTLFGITAQISAGSTDVEMRFTSFCIRKRPRLSEMAIVALREMDMCSPGSIAKSSSVPRDVKVDLVFSRVILQYTRNIEAHRLAHTNVIKSCTLIVAQWQTKYTSSKRR
jgi:hypothetical protein